MVKPKPASTLVIMKDNDESASLEILMLLRSHRSSFVPGNYVFPGGGMDSVDNDTALMERCAGIDRLRAPGFMGHDVDTDRAVAYCITAIRETFEESGLLYAYDHSGHELAFDHPEIIEKYSGYQREINNGKLCFADMVVQEELSLATDRLKYLSHWVTPPFSSIRYSTRFFAALAPKLQHVQHDGREIVQHLWLNPGEALKEHKRGCLNMVLPTVYTLRALANYTTAGEALNGMQ